MTKDSVSFCMCKEKGRMHVLSAHAQATPDEKPSLQLAKSFRFARLCIKTLKLRLHVLVRERDAGIYQRVYLRFALSNVTQEGREQPDTPSGSAYCVSSHPQRHIHPAKQGAHHQCRLASPRPSSPSRSQRQTLEARVRTISDRSPINLS